MDAWQKFINDIYKGIPQDKSNLYNNIYSYIVDYKWTIRKVADNIDIPRSTVHYIIHHYIKKYDYCMYQEICNQLNYNFKHRFDRGRK